LRLEVCPNCDKRAPGGLYIHEPEDLDLLTVTHCGCFHEGDPDEVECHATRPPYGPGFIHKPP